MPQERDASRRLMARILSTHGSAIMIYLRLGHYSFVAWLLFAYGSAIISLWLGYDSLMARRRRRARAEGVAARRLMARILSTHGSAIMIYLWLGYYSFVAWPLFAYGSAIISSWLGSCLLMARRRRRARSEGDAARRGRDAARDGRADGERPLLAGTHDARRGRRHLDVSSTSQ